MSNLILIGAQAVVRAHFGQGTGPIVLDQVNCTSEEMLLLQCSQNPLFVHNCHHSEDAGVICRDEHRLASINATVLDQGTATVTISIAWQLANDILDTPRLFEISCFNERYHMLVTENNETLITRLELGAVNQDRFSYNCCVSAIYNTLQPATPATKICTQLHLERTNYPMVTSTAIPTDVPSSTTMSTSDSESVQQHSNNITSVTVLDQQ